MNTNFINEMIKEKWQFVKTVKIKHLEKEVEKIEPWKNLFFEKIGKENASIWMKH